MSVTTIDRSTVDEEANFELYSNYCIMINNYYPVLTVFLPSSVDVIN